MCRSAVLQPGYPISIKKCPSNGLQIYPMCSPNSVYLPPLSPYTYFRDQIAMGPFDCEHIPCDCRGTGEMNVACMKSKQRRSIHEKDTVLPRDRCAYSDSEWVLTIRSGIGSHGTCRCQPACQFCQCFIRSREVDEVRGHHPPALRVGRRLLAQHDEL